MSSRVKSRSNVSTIQVTRWTREANSTRLTKLRANYSRSVTVVQAMKFTFRLPTILQRPETPIADCSDRLFTEPLHKPLNSIPIYLFYNRCNYLDHAMRNAWTWNRAWIRCNFVFLRRKEFFFYRFCIFPIKHNLRQLSRRLEMLVTSDL